MIEHLEVLVEEPSTEAALRVLLPRYLQDVTFEVYPHQGKGDLLNKLPQRLRGYAAWLPENWRIVVLVDRDDDDCVELKRQMEDFASRTALSTRSSRPKSHAVVNRIAIEELEAWYFGDWDAVREVFPKVSATVSAQSAYRDPDAISGGTWEAFERILQAGGYMEGGLRKTEAARAIAAHLIPERNISRSFQSFWSGIIG